MDLVLFLDPNFTFFGVANHSAENTHTMFGSGNTNHFMFLQLDHFDVSNLEDSLAHFHTNSQHGHGITQSHQHTTPERGKNI